VETKLEKNPAFGVSGLTENKGGGVVQKPKRRPYLLKKKALSTGFFESGAKRDDPSKGT